MKRPNIFFLSAMLTVILILCSGYLVESDINASNERLLFDAIILESHLSDDMINNDLFADCEYSNYAVNRAPVYINEEFFYNIDINEGELITVNLFSGDKCTVKVEKTETDINGVTSVSGSIVDNNDDRGHFYLTSNEDIVLLTLEMFSKSSMYVVSYNGLTETHYFFEIPFENIDLPDNISSLTIPPPSLEDEISIAGSEIADITGNPLEHVVVDVMVLYTPNAEAWASTRGGINSIINQAVERGNTALDNSDTSMNIRLVHSARVDYTESNNGNDSSTDLNRLRNTSDGYMDEVHAWRDEYGADLVALFTECHDTGGLGYMLTESHLNFPDWSAQYGFSLTRVQQASWTYTLIHELGHNMGAGHHKEQNVQAGPQCFNYSAGWRWSVGSTWYNSVMSYSGGSYFSNGITSISAPYFSNPNVNHQGVPTGHATNADNARTLRETKHFVADYREAVIPPPKEWINLTPWTAGLLLFGDVTGDGEENLVGTFEQGTFYWDNRWIRLAVNVADIALFGDVTGDGKENLVITTVNGTFYWDNSWIRLSVNPAEIALFGDVTGDGKENLVITTVNGTFYWDNRWIRLSVNPADIALFGDVTGGGKENLVITTANGTFYWDNRWIRLAVNAAEIALFGDVTGDGKENLVITTANGTFYWENRWIILSVDPAEIALFGDVTGDGKDSLVIATVNGTFYWDNLWIRLAVNAADIALFGDVTGDGKENLVITTANGTFYWDNDSWIQLSPNKALLLAFGDITGEGKDNLVAAFENGTFYWE